MTLRYLFYTCAYSHSGGGVRVGKMPWTGVLRVREFSNLLEGTSAERWRVSGSIVGW